MVNLATLTFSGYDSSVPRNNRRFNPFKSVPAGKYPVVLLLNDRAIRAAALATHPEHVAAINTMRGMAVLCSQLIGKEPVVFFLDDRIALAGALL